MIIPNKLLSAEYAIETRRFLSHYRILAIRDYSTVPVFHASVYPIVIILQKQSPKKDGSLSVEIATGDNGEKINSVGRALQSEMVKSDTWSLIFDTEAKPILSKMSANSMPLRIICDVDGAASTSEAYKLIPHIHNFSSQANYFKFINTGTIDPYVEFWDTETTAYIKHRFIRPIVLRNVLQHEFPRRAEQSSSPKLIIGGMTKRLECYLDRKGEYLAGKSTVVVTPKPSEGEKPKLVVLLAIVNSKLMTLWYRTTFKSLSLAGNFIRVGPPQIRELPIRLGTALQQWNLEMQSDSLYRLNENLKRIPENSDSWKETSRQIFLKEREVDNTVYEVYGLNPTEIETVDKSVGRFFSSEFNTG